MRPSFPGKLLDWVRHSLTDLSQRKVEEELDDNAKGEIDFEALSDPANPNCTEMRRRYHVQQAREELNDLE
jgi:hypothetical protein